MLQVVNTAAPAMPLERPHAGAPRRPEAGAGKASDSFAALVDETVRSTSERDEPSSPGRPSAATARDEAGEPADDADDALDARGGAPEVASAIAASLWLVPETPPVNPDPPGDSVVEIVAADPAVTSFADRDGAEPAHSAWIVADRGPVPDVAGPRDAHSGLAAAPAVSLSSASAAGGQTAIEDGLASADEGAPGPAPAGLPAEPVSQEASAAGPPVEASPQRVEATKEQPLAVRTEGGVVDPIPEEQPLLETSRAGETAGDARATDASTAVAPRWNARLANQLQRALKTTGERTSAHDTDAAAAPAAVPVSAVMFAPATAAGAGGSGDGASSESAMAGSRATGGSAPVPSTPAPAPADFARYVAAAQGPESRAAAQAPDEVAPQLVQAMRLQAIQGGGEARVQLRPEHLGAVTIDLRVEHGRVSASFNAEVPAVRQWLEAHEGSLRQGLSEHGLQLERFVVSKDGEAPQRDPQGHEDARRRQARRSRPDEEQITFEVVV